jgi:tRNA(adenine34) deaminase
VVLHQDETGVAKRLVEHPRLFAGGGGIAEPPSEGCQVDDGKAESHELTVTPACRPASVGYIADVTTDEKSTTEQRAADEQAMRRALDEAKVAAAHGDVPVGAVVLRNGEVIAARHNEREKTGDPTAHAEVLALRDAAAALGRWRLDDCTLVVTLEPCVMCAGALLNARIGRLVFGAADPKAGATSTLYNVCADPRLNHNPPFQHGVLAAESAALLADFFAERR